MGLRTCTGIQLPGICVMHNLSFGLLAGAARKGAPAAIGYKVALHWPFAGKFQQPAVVHVPVSLPSHSLCLQTIYVP